MNLAGVRREEGNSSDALDFRILRLEIRVGMGVRVEVEFDVVMQRKGVGGVEIVLREPV